MVLIYTKETELKAKFRTMKKIGSEALSKLKYSLSLTHNPLIFLWGEA